MRRNRKILRHLQANDIRPFPGRVAFDDRELGALGIGRRGPPLQRLGLHRCVLVVAGIGKGGKRGRSQHGKNNRLTHEGSFFDVVAEHDAEIGDAPRPPFEGGCVMETGRAHGLAPLRAA